MSNISEATEKDWEDFLMKTLLSTWMVVSVVVGRLNQHLILKNLVGHGKD